ncbi:MAG TPA: adenylate/guanylate cyclase domain-containing protein [Acidimicrobiales bacterium]|jgi:adenylate cyclase|nr:adenylate/guanylate cyclase domain-containing protein [Acidimicrobiales bacterium]
MSLRSLPAVAEEVRRSIRRRLLFANIAGGLAVITFVQLASGERLAPELPLPLILAAPFVPAALLLLPAYVWGHRAFSRAIAWAVEQRAPTPAERYAILREPWRQALRPLVFWIIAAGLYASLSALAGADGQTVLRVVDGTLIGGVTTCAIAYLMIERSFRPLFAHVLAGRPEARLRTPAVRLRLMLAWAVGSGVPLLAIAAVSLLDGTEIPTYALSVLALIGLAAGLLATVSSAGTIAEPLDGLRAALGQVRDGNLDVGLAVDDGGEVGEVQAGFNDMVDGLRERRALQDLFGRHVGREVARRALERGTGLSGEQAEASAVFVDLIGSTAMTEVLPPGEVVDTLNDYFDVVVDTVDAHGGWVNKFEGDGALCIFGVPGTQPDHPDRALRAARQLSTRLDLLAERHPGLEAGIGVSSGRVVAGNVGTEARYEYTVIGPAVNEASRLTDIAKGRAVRVLASAESVRRASAEASHWHDVGTVALRGRATPTAIYEPLVEHAAPAEARQ